MTDAPYFSFWAKDWLTGEGTRLMTPEQKGAFIDLLSHAWLSTSEPCTLPGDDASLARLSGLGRRWLKVGAPVLAEFEPTGSGRLRNDKLFRVWTEMEERHERRVQAGTRGGRPKALDKQSESNALAMPKQPKPKAKPKTTKSLPAGAGDEEFEAVYAALPKRTGGHDRKAAHLSYTQSVAKGAIPAEMLDGAHRYRVFCDAILRTGTTYVFEGKNFLGERELWKDDWTIPLTVSRGQKREPNLTDPNAPGYAAVVDGVPNAEFLKLIGSTG